MKILFLIPYVHSDTLEVYQKFSVGLSYTLESIIKKMSLKGHDVYVYTQSTFSPGYEEDDIHYLPKKLLGAMKISPYYFKSFFDDTWGDVISLRLYIHIFSYYLFGKDVENYIKKIQPDIVSIRGIGYVTRPFILACKRLKMKYVISLHGSNSLSDTIRVTENEKEMEKQLFRDAANGLEHVTVISSGIKSRILKSIGYDFKSIKHIGNIRVVNNGVDLEPSAFSKKELDLIKTYYNIGRDDKVFISAGTICERKNQMQILRAFHLLPEEEKSHSKLLFLGKGDLLEKLNEEIDYLDEKDRVFVCGFIPIGDVQKYFAISDVNVVASVDEGFGRAFIEGFLLGVPAVTYSDLDAVDDLYDECVMIRVNQRSDHSLSDGFCKALHRKWDRKYIQKHALKFSVDNMVAKYEAIYEECVKNV